MSLLSHVTVAPYVLSLNPDCSPVYSSPSQITLTSYILRKYAYRTVHANTICVYSLGGEKQRKEK